MLHVTDETQRRRRRDYKDRRRSKITPQQIEGERKLDGEQMRKRRDKRSGERFKKSRSTSEGQFSATNQAAGSFVSVTQPPSEPLKFHRINHKLFQDSSDS